MACSCTLDKIRCMLHLNVHSTCMYYSMYVCTRRRLFQNSVLHDIYKSSMKFIYSPSYSMRQKNVSNLVPFRSMNRSFSFSFVFGTLGSTPKGKEVEQCKYSLACSCSCVYFRTGSYSDYVWNEQSKNHVPSILIIYGSTFVESGLGQ